MKAATIQIEDKIDELLVALDKDIEHIEESLLRLNEIRGLVIKRDESALGSLLESIQLESDSYRNHELKRQSIRKELAIAFGCNIEQMTLTRLEEMLADGKRAQLAEKKERLIFLTGELKKEHIATTMLLSSCAKFNRAVLENVFKFGKTDTVTYDVNGSAKQQRETAFMNLRF